jgi:PAS domain S-box-containing protein
MTFEGDRLEPFSRLRTRDGLFVTDIEQRITYWSATAERLLGIEAAEALGRPCFEVLLGFDFSGHPFCRDRCPIALNAARGRPVQDYEIRVTAQEGRATHINNSVLLWPREGGGFEVVHLFREVRRGRRRVQQLPRRTSAGYVTPLSRRELEVLRLASTGMRTADVAEALGISFFTARNQLASVLRKLNCRTRGEAIATAIDNGLI